MSDNEKIEEAQQEADRAMAMVRTLMCASASIRDKPGRMRRMLELLDALYVWQDALGRLLDLEAGR